MAALKLSPEADLVVRSALAVGDKDLLGDPPGEDLDWLAVGQIAEREKLLPILWPALAGYHDLIPGPVAQAMERQTVVTEFRMATLEDQLRTVIRVLDDHDIPVMLMKGAALALTVYGSFARRPMGDLDILVRAADAKRAWELLHREGWTREYEDAEEFYEEHQHLTPLVSPDGAGAIVEIHRCLLYPKGPFQLPEDEVWDAAAPVKVGGRTAWVPAPEHQVLHAAIHYAWSHSLGRGLGRTVRDLGALLDTRQVEWDAVVELARRTKSETCCYWTLRFTRNLGGVDVPRDVLARLAPRGPRLLTNSLERVLVAHSIDPVQGVLPSVRLRHFVWERAIQPESSGHGGVRPWKANAGWSDVVNSGPRPGVLRRLVGQLRRLPEWARLFRIAAGGRVAG
ncbi:MAG TPA: nucleotidyltransferase family protein [Longimicrobiales bacterium]|nr:nucleotidyltransferase family protein [Longimicrobiales bacterium]